MDRYATKPSPDEIVEIAARSELLSLVKRDYLTWLRDDLEWIELPAGQVLFRQGEPIDSMYFVASGSLHISKQTEAGQTMAIADVRAGGTVGEMQIITGGMRSATVEAGVDSQLIRCSQVAFERFLASHEQVLRKIAKIVVPRLHRDQMVRVLPRLFGELDKDAIRELEKRMRWRHLERGETLYVQGDPSDSFCIIISGRLQVLIQTDGPQPISVGEMGQGETVGEMGALTHQPRSATIKALRDTELAEFSRDQLDGLLKTYPTLLPQMLRLTMDRLRRAQRASRRIAHSSSLTILPVSPNAPLESFAARLAETMSATDTCLLLTSERVNQELGMADVAQAKDGEPNDLRLRMWLNDMEGKFQFILYQTDRQASNWTIRCLRQADELVLVGDAADTPELSAIDREVILQDKKKGTTSRQSLVLVHRDGTRRPSGTLRWLILRPEVDRHFHVRMDAHAQSDFQRVARFVGGHAIGLVLSGGGARGFAHVGVIRAMQRRNIPIDMIAGVSMGSLLAAGFAFQENFDEMVELIKQQLRGSMGDYMLPIFSLAAGRRFNRRLQKLFDDVRIEDLWLPYFCVSSNLTRSEIKVHDRGLLWSCVRASGSLPGIVPPVILDGDLHFDGCLLNNLPMDVMRRHVGHGKVIAVDVVPPVMARRVQSQFECPSGWQILWSRLNPFVTTIDVPNIAYVLQRAGELGAVHARQRLIEQHLADKYLAPKFVEDYEILDFKKVDEIAEKGSSYAVREVDSWSDLQEFALGGL